MKKFANIIHLVVALVALLFASSCKEEFVESYPELRIDTDLIKVSYEGDETVIGVYFDGNWHVEFEETHWLTLSNTSGRGVGFIGVVVAANSGMSRKSVLKIHAGGECREIGIVQVTGIANPSITFDNTIVELPNLDYNHRLYYSSNITEPLTLSVEYDEGVEPWISEAKYVAPEGEERGYVEFQTSSFEGSEARKAKLVLSMTDAEETTISDTAELTQENAIPYITMDDMLILSDGVENGIVDIKTNLTTLVDSFTIRAEYLSDEKEFFSNLAIVDGKVHYSISENTSTSRRKANIVVALPNQAGDAELATGKMLFQQRFVAMPKPIEFEALRSLLNPNGSIIYSSNDDDYSHYIEGVVISDCENPNTDHNINTAANTITTFENDRTAYIQSLDGKYGFRLKFATAEDNELKRGEKVRVAIEAAKITGEPQPTRYTIENLTAKSITKTGESATIVEKLRTIATLTDEDVYTHVTIQNLEFSQKYGSYTNVREHDAIDNPLKAPLAGAPTGAYVHAAKDGAVNHLYDNEGKSIYMLINMNCTWRRDGQVPQGVGSVSGVIVHNYMERWGGNVGTYSIRPFDKSSIAISESGSAYSTLVEWYLDKATHSAAQYIWNSNTTIGGYVQSTEANSPKDHYTNKLHATIDNTSGAGTANESAMFYSENQIRNVNDVRINSGWNFNLASGYSAYTLPTTLPASAPYYGQARCNMMELQSNPAGWYVWDDNEKWTGETKGVVLDFSTEGISGSAALVSFAAWGGVSSRDSEANVSWTNAHGFPVYWRVEYSTSTDGENWSAYTEVKNTATNANGFELRSLPWAISGSSVNTTIHSTNKKAVWTQSDWGFGEIPYQFELPAEIFGKKRVKVRLAPSSDILASWNSGEKSYNLGQTYTQTRVSKQYAQATNAGISLKEVRIIYK